jgi:hypothetical protein
MAGETVEVRVTMKGIELTNNDLPELYRIIFQGFLRHRLTLINTDLK